VQAV
jgi:ribonuclease HI